MYLFIKAQIKGAETGDLFRQPVLVTGYTTKGGKTVASHVAGRHKHTLVLARKDAMNIPHPSETPAPPAAPQQSADDRPGHYYVSMVDGPKRALLLGPFAKHDEALAHVEPARQVVNDMDQWSHFYGFGTARLKDDAPAIPKGKLNDHTQFKHLFQPPAAN